MRRSNVTRAPARALTVSAAVAALLGMVPAALAQVAYPTRPIRLVVPYVPGGGTTLMARMVGQHLTERWGQSVVLDNRPGAGGIVGAETVARAQSDGYTLLFTAVSDHLLVSVLQKTSYDAIKSFAPAATVAIAERILVVNPAVPANTLHELIALAKAKPGQLNYASLGNGSTAHVGIELLAMLSGIKLTHVPYKGGAQAVTDLVAGQVQLYLGSITSMGAFIKAGKLKAIAITGSARVPVLPQVPTFTEAGMAGYDVKLWYGVLAPAGTPVAVLDALNAEIGRLVAADGMKDKLQALGMVAFASTRQEMAPMMAAEVRRYAEVIRAANIKSD
jgi:tripartite-type tricarboxylate transporter receptor subunit TctC